MTFATARTFALALALLSACSHEKKNEPARTAGPKEAPQAPVFDNSRVPENILTLNTPPEKSRLGSAHNLFGKFFCDRASFYIIKNPRNNLYSAQPESITLYYLDDKLSQVQYVMSRDITHRLIWALGNFRIVGHDEHNRALLESGKILVSTDSTRTLNPELDNYKLIWTFGEKQVTYRVNRRSIGEEYVYAERMKDYDKRFREIERVCL